MLRKTKAYSCDAMDDQCIGQTLYYQASTTACLSSDNPGLEQLDISEIILYEGRILQNKKTAIKIAYYKF